LVLTSRQNIPEYEKIKKINPKIFLSLVAFRESLRFFFFIEMSPLTMSAFSDPFARLYDNFSVFCSNRLGGGGKKV